MIANGADRYQSILKDGRKWLVSVKWYDSDENIERFWFAVDKDTVINNTRSKKIICTNADNPEEKEVAYAAEDNGAIYGFYLDISCEYDHKWIKEDVLKIDCEAGMDFNTMSQLKAVGVDYIPMGNSMRRRIKLEAPEYPKFGNLYWVEGIGASNIRGWIFIWFPKPTCLCIRNRFIWADMFNIEEVYDNDVLILTKDDFSQASGIKTIYLEKDAEDDTAYDIFGRRVTNPQRGSVYIRAGRKFVGK